MENRIRNILYIAVAIALIGFLLANIQFENMVTSQEYNEETGAPNLEEEHETQNGENKNDPIEVSKTSNSSIKPTKSGSKSPSTNKQNRAVASIPPPSNGRDIEKYLNDEFPGNWILQRDQAGDIFRVMGGEIPFDNNADSVAETLAEIVVGGQVELKEVSTKEVDHHYFQQTCKGIDIFKGSVRIYSNSGGKITMVNLNLFPINCDRFNPIPSLNFEEAKEAASSHYPSARFNKVESIIVKVPYLMIWATKETAHIAYLYRVTLTEPFDIREVVIDGQNGAVLADNPLIVY